MPCKLAHAGDFHLDEDHHFGDTAHCLEWFVEDAVRSGVHFFCINGDLTTYKATSRNAIGGSTCSSAWQITLRSSWLLEITVRS